MEKKLIRFLRLATLTTLAASAAWGQGLRSRAEADRETLPWVAGEILVQLAANASRGDAAALAARSGLRLKRCGESGLCALAAPAGVSEIGLARFLRGVEGLRWASPNFLARQSGLAGDSIPPNDPFFPSQTSLNLINAPSAWEINMGAESVAVAVIDSGVAYEDRLIPDYELPDVQPGVTRYRLSPDLALTRFLPGYDFVHGDPFPNDDHFHGTAVAAVIAQDTNNGMGAAGAAPGVSVMPIKAASSQGYATLEAIIEAVRFATRQGVDVVNLGVAFDAGLSNPAFDPYFAGLDEALAAAHEAGIVLVAGSGNSGRGLVSRPAVHPAVIAVGATELDGWKRAYYSQHSTEEASYGIPATPGLPGSIELAAPVGTFEDGLSEGVVQETFRPGTPEEFGVFRVTGTSFSAPQAAGVAALMISAGQRPVKDALAVEILREILRQTAVDLWVPGRDLIFGAGLLDAGAALRADTILVCHQAKSGPGATLKVQLSKLRDRIAKQDLTLGPCSG